MTTVTTGSVRADYHTPQRRPARRTSDGRVFSLIGTGWVRVLNPLLAESFEPQPAADQLLEAIMGRGYPDPMPATLAASIAAKWGLDGPPLSPSQITEMIPTAWICHVLAARGVSPYAVRGDLPTYDSRRWA